MKSTSLLLGAANIPEASAKNPPLYVDKVRHITRALSGENSHSVNVLSSQDILLGTHISLTLNTEERPPERVFLETVSAGKKTKFHAFNNRGLFLGEFELKSDLRVGQDFSQHISDGEAGALSGTISRISVNGAQDYVHIVQEAKGHRELLQRQQEATQEYLDKLLSNTDEAQMVHVGEVCDYLYSDRAEKAPIFYRDSAGGMFTERARIDGNTLEDITLRAHINHIAQQEWYNIEDRLMQEGVNFGMDTALMYFGPHFRKNHVGDIKMRDGTLLTPDKLSDFSGAVQHQYATILQEMKYRGVWSEDVSARPTKRLRPLQIEKNNEKMVSFVAEKEREIAAARELVAQSGVPDLNPTSPYNQARMKLMIAIAQRHFAQEVAKTGELNRNTMYRVYKDLFIDRSASGGIEMDSHIFIDLCCGPVYDTLNTIQKLSLLHPPLNRKKV